MRIPNLAESRRDRQRGTAMGAAARAEELKVLLSRQKIARRVRALGAQITADYRGRPLHVIGILKGSWVFMADLLRHLDLDVTVDCLGFASYCLGAASHCGVPIHTIP